MGAIFMISGILIYIYAFDHNPPHIHVRSSGRHFTVTINDRIVDGEASPKEIRIVNKFLDEHMAEVMALWEKAQKGEKIDKII